MHGMALRELLTFDTRHTKCCVACGEGACRALPFLPREEQRTNDVVQQWRGQRVQGSQGSEQRQEFSYSRHGCLHLRERQEACVRQTMHRGDREAGDKCDIKARLLAHSCRQPVIHARHDVDAGLVEQASQAVCG